MHLSTGAPASARIGTCSRSGQRARRAGRGRRDVVRTCPPPLREAVRPHLERTPGRAIEQTDHTATLTSDRHGAVHDVPGDGPLIGLVVTLDPYFQSNSDLVWSRPESKSPVMVAASRELKALVTITDVGSMRSSLPRRGRGALAGTSAMPSPSTSVGSTRASIEPGTATPSERRRLDHELMTRAAATCCQMAGDSHFVVSRWVTVTSREGKGGLPPDL